MARVIKFLNPKSDEISKLIFHNDICEICLIWVICGSDYMKFQLLKSLRKESEEIKNPEILNIDNLLVNLDKSIRSMGTGIKAIILDKDMNVKKVEFAARPPNILADAPEALYIKEETPEIKKEVKKQESNRWLLERIAPENMQRLNMSTGLRREREKEREMLLSG